jgi:hypothetical protein
LARDTIIPLMGAAIPDHRPVEVLRDAALRDMSAAVAACGNGLHGAVGATVTVSGATGVPTKVRVTGRFAGTRTGECIERALRHAWFPRSREDTFSVSRRFHI